MTVRDVVIALCFLGSILLTTLGGWNYMKDRVLAYEEKVKIEKTQAMDPFYYSSEDVLKKIRKEKNNALIMFAAGFTGFFLVVSYISRRKKMNPFIQQNKTKRS